MKGKAAVDYGIDDDWADGTVEALDSLRREEVPIMNFHWHTSHGFSYNNRKILATRSDSTGVMRKGLLMRLCDLL